MTNERAYVGTDLKFIVEPTSPGFDKTTDEFEVTIRRGKVSQTFRKEDLIVDEENNYYVCFSSSDFGKGLIQAVVTAHVPDEDFEDGYREEVDVIDLINILSV